MKYSPFADKKFLTLLVDCVMACVLYFTGKYAPATIFEDVKFVFGLLQPLVLMYIANLFVADARALRAGLELPHLK